LLGNCCKDILRSSSRVCVDCMTPWDVRLEYVESAWSTDVMHRSHHKFCCIATAGVSTAGTATCTEALTILECNTSRKWIFPSCKDDWSLMLELQTLGTIDRQQARRWRRWWRWFWAGKRFAMKGHTTTRYIEEKGNDEYLPLNDHLVRCHYVFIIWSFSKSRYLLIDSTEARGIKIDNMSERSITFPCIIAFLEFDELFIAFMKRRFETIQAAKDWLSSIVQEGQVYQWIKHTVREILIVTWTRTSMQSMVDLKQI
jgi:hypothetical protein